MSYRRGASITYRMNHLSSIKLRANSETKRLLGRATWRIIENKHRARIMKAVKDIQKEGGDVNAVLQGHTPEQKLLILFELSRQRPLTEEEMNEYRECYRKIVGEKACQGVFEGRVRK